MSCNLKTLAIKLILSLTVSCLQLTLLKSRKSLRRLGNTAQEQLNSILSLKKKKKKKKLKQKERKGGGEGKERREGKEGRREGVSVNILVSTKEKTVFLICFPERKDS